jgi:hypothetical protein
MVEVAEDATFTLGDLRFMAANWAAGLSCHLHGAQKGVAMAALGVVAAYRLAFPENVVVPYALRLPMYGVELGSMDRCREDYLCPETNDQVLKWPTRSPNESDVVSKGPPNEGKVKQANEWHQRGMALVLLGEAILQALKLCLSILLVCVGILLLLGVK